MGSDYLSTLLKKLCEWMGLDGSGRDADGTERGVEIF